MSSIEIPSTPQVISPSPTASEQNEDGYFPPTTRSASKRRAKEPSPDSELEARARARSRSPATASLRSSRRRKSGLAALTMKDSDALKSGKASTGSGLVKKSQPLSNGAKAPNGHLSPSSAATPGSSYWRDLSRSPSPLGLIPLHQQWRSFIHRHEIPRKALHVSIGFVTLRLYTLGIQPASIHPWLIGALVPIASVDILRRRWVGLNRVYVRLLGALMRESEVHDRYNGVIWYLLGTWVAMRFMPKDIGVMSILLLSWCDTAASTVGRKWGKYTPKIRQGKSLAGTAAACVVGVATAWLWWGWVVPAYFGFEEDFQFKGYLTAPRMPGSDYDKKAVPAVTGWIALGVMSVWSGVVASVSEAIDVFNWDDNLTIPVLSGIGLWGFLKAFG